MPIALPIRVLERRVLARAGAIDRLVARRFGARQWALMYYVVSESPFYDPETGHYWPFIRVYYGPRDFYDLSIMKLRVLEPGLFAELTNPQ